MILESSNRSLCRITTVDVEVIVSKKVSICGKFWINSGLAEEVQSDGCLIEKSVPFADRKIGIGC